MFQPVPFSSGNASNNVPQPLHTAARKPFILRHVPQLASLLIQNPPHRLYAPAREQITQGSIRLVGNSRSLKALADSEDHPVLSCGY